MLSGVEQSEARVPKHEQAPRRGRMYLAFREHSVTKYLVTWTQLQSWAPHDLPYCMRVVCTTRALLVDVIGRCYHRLQM